MKYHLTIIAGETTCYDVKTKLSCSLIVVSHFGTHWACGLFRNDDGTNIELNESNPLELEKSLLLRCDKCINTLTKID